MDYKRWSEKNLKPKVPFRKRIINFILTVFRLKKEFKCDFCGYTDKESRFLSGECPACCRDIFTWNTVGILFLFFSPESEKNDN